MALTPEDLKALSKPFPDDRIGVKVQSISKDKLKLLLVAYLQHTDVMDRLEQTDPNWGFKSLEVYDKGDYCQVRGILSIKGVERENVGDGNDMKAAFSDCIKRCAMSFGVGRYLYDQETKWVNYDERADKYRTYTIEDLYGKRPNGAKPTPVAPVAPKSPIAPSQPIIPKGTGPGHDDSQRRPSLGGGYVVLFGKYEGKLVSELTDIERNNLKNFWGEKKLAGEKLGPKAQDLLDAISAFEASQTKDWAEPKTKWEPPSDPFDEGSFGQI